MSFSHDRRGQSVVVGTVILFGFLILAMATYQVQFVPMENEEIEFEHSQQVEGEFLDLRNAILQAGSTGSAQSKRIQLGTRYPQRTFFLNPPPASGTLETTEAREIRFENVSVEGGENVEAYWGNNDLTFNTSSIQYRPDYNEYRGAPRLTYEHSAIAGEFDNEAVLLRSSQTVVRGDDPGNRSLSLTMLSGDVSENGVEPASIDFQTVSQGSRTVTVSGGSDGWLVLPTAVENETKLAERWDQRTPVTVEPVPAENAIRIELDGTYPLRLSAVSMDGSEQTGPAYIVRTTGRNTTVDESVGVEVRDRYNNPVSGVTVASDGPERVTNEDGQAFFEPDASGMFEASINGGGESYEVVDFDVTETGGGGDANRTFSTRWDSASTTVVENRSRSLNVTVSDRESGNPITNATIDYSISPDSPNGSLSKLTESVHSGTDSVTFEAGSAHEGESLGVYASAGDDVGRTELTVIGGTVDLQDEIFENDSNFTVDHELTNLDSGYLVVENEDTGGTYEDTIGDGSTTVDAADVGGINDGDTINSTLYDNEDDLRFLDGNDVTVRSEGTGGLPANSVAYADANNNGQYDSGETEYTASELQNFDEPVDLVVARDVTTNEYDVSANSITIQDGVLLNTDGGGNEAISLTATQGLVRIAGQIGRNSYSAVTIEGPSIDLSGGEIRSGGGIQITTNGGQLILEDSVVDATSGQGQQITLESAGALMGTNANIVASGSVTVSSGNAEDITFDGATIDTTSGSNPSVSITSAGAFSGIGVDVITDGGSVTIESEDGNVDLNDGVIDVSAGGVNADVTLTTSNELYLERSQIVGDRFSDFIGNRENNGQNVYVQDAIFERANGDPKDFDVDPGSRNGPNPPTNVNGTPQKGTVI
ncbi:hypothetical protein [Halorubrum sp. F4]|uniref:hypothetical protein n=1 Tax=Halorubrum sp. F4 TaxID=2989715 RepID=UPI002480041B|nr:hypothetical protein [Halorubrum sp. F4]